MTRWNMTRWNWTGIAAMASMMAISGIGPAAGDSKSESSAIRTAAQELASLDWMAGQWTGTERGVVSEEHWTGTAGGGLVGMHKDVQGDRMVSFEFLRIGSGPDGRVTYFSSPNGAPQTLFGAKEVGGARVVFENLDHDFPQRILYWLDGEGRLHARIEGPMDGKPVSEEWVWTRVVAGK